MKIQEISSARLCLLASLVVVLGIWLMFFKILYLPNSLNGLMKSVEHDFTESFSLIFPILISPLILASIFIITFIKLQPNKGTWCFYLVPLVAVFILCIFNYLLSGYSGAIVFTIPFLIWPFYVGITKNMKGRDERKKLNKGNS